MSYIEHVVESEKKKKVDVNNIIIIIREYPDVFMKELPGLHLKGRLKSPLKP